jgi:hypothetical protein
MTIILTIIGFIILFYVYFLPSWVAHKRKHHQYNAIATLNLLLGWTLLGWVAALIWAMTATYGSDLRITEPSYDDASRTEAE